MKKQKMLFATGELYEGGFYLEYKEINLKKTRKKRHYFRVPSGLIDTHLGCPAYPDCDEWPMGCCAVNQGALDEYN